MFPRLRFLSLSVLFIAALLAPPASGQSGRPIEGELLVKFRPTAVAADRASARALVQGRALHDFSFIRVEHVKVEGMTSEQAMARLRNNPHVEYVEPNYEIQLDLVPNDPSFPQLYAMRNTGQTGGTVGADIKAVNAWDLFTGDPNLKVGVIDTGVDYNHPDLAANAWTNPGEIPGNLLDDDNNGYVDDVHGYDFVNNDGDPFDDNGHGTHCSGTIAGVGNNNTGVVGVCWQAKIVGIKFLNAGGSGSTDGAIAGVQYAIAVGVRLTSNSWGGGGFSQALLDAINAAGAAGQLFMAAAGNSSSNNDVTPHYPSSYDSPYIIAVAATDHNDNLASFSSYGATSVDLAAPGVSILSCQPGGGYQLLSGTSMATPHVSGAVALVMGRFPGITNTQAKALILNSADVKAQLAGRCLTSGRLNAFMTIADPDSTPPGAIADLATTNPGSNTMGLTWTATGDDGGTGRASRYEIRYSTAPIDAGNFGAATLVTGPDPLTAGSAESFEVGGLAFTTLYYFAIKAFDEFSNAGPISNVPTGTTLAAPDIAAAPGSFSATLLTGATEAQTLTLTNTAGGTLDFTVPTPDLVFTQPVLHDYQPTPKDQDDIRIGFPVTENQGGPDGFGYRWVDSNEPGGPTFSWVDITGVGSLLALTGDDATSAPVAMGMSFPYYGSTFSSVRICTNGFLSFTDAATTFENQPLPNAGAPANLVAAFWDDLDFGATPRVYTHNDGVRFIVSWVAAPHYQTGGPYTFQAILYPTGEIRYQYLSMAAPTNSASLGIQNAAKNIGLTVAFNTNYVADNLAVRIIPLSQWLTVSPTAGRISAGGSADLNVMFNALGLTGGNYTGTVNVLSNDPDESPLALPASLHVIGAPNIAVNPAAMDFGTVFVGATPTQTLTVSNPGTDDLAVSGISSDHAFVTVDPPTAFTLTPSEARNLTVRFSPTSPATVNATLAILSNDPDSPSTPVTVAGVSVPAPSFSVTPESFSEALLTNTAVSRNLRISNSGGSNYVFTAEAQVNTASGTVVVQGDADNVDLPKGAPDVLTGPAPLRAGGPDVFGYTYQDSDEPGGPVFSWVDIRGLPGTVQIAMTGDDTNTGPHPIGFDFPFYGQTFNSFRICTNGFVSFTSTLTTFGNTSLPNSGSSVPNNLLAVFWDDMNFAAVQRAYRRYDGTRLIVQYQDVPRFGDTANPNTFQIQIFPNGTIVYQYLTMNAVTKNSATIGIQNAAKNDGLQVVFNALYVKNNLAIRFRPPARFLTVTPTGGTVPAGQFLDLTVGFNAAGLFGGVYDGQIHIVGNDPVLPVKNVPCQLTVTGVPDIAVNPATIDFGNVFIGFPQLRQLTVNNVGTDNLVVSNITSTDPVYGVDLTNFTVPPLGNAVLFTAFNPGAAISYPASLTIASNDPDTPNRVVTLAGTGVVAPDVGTDPTSIAQTLNIPATASQTLTVSNTGGSDLTFVVGTTLTASEVPVYEALELGKEENDPRPGVLGSGGPDIFGYTWRDSDEPGGPAFDWVDITGIGTPVTFSSGDDANAQSIPIGFSFPFYGASFTTVNVCTNGWASFTNTTTDLSNDPLPNTAAPENMLAAFWDDLLPGLSPARVFRYSDGTRFILSYVGVPRFSSGGPYTFQVILYPSGRIVYQYLDMQAPLNGATIGIQNAAKNDGLTVVHNAAYVHNNLAVEFRTTPEYMTVSPTSGTIPAGQSALLNVNFDTQGLFGGLYQGSIRIASNDPDEGVVLVPTALTAVGVPNIATTPASLDFGSVYVGLSADLTVEVRNIGTDVLTVTGGTLGDAQYSLVGASFPIALGQNGSAVLTVRFTPTSAWTPGSPCPPPTAVPSVLTLASNDPDGDKLVPLAGVAVVPAEIETTPATLRAALATTLGPTAIQRTKTLLIRNTGCSDLNWSAEAMTAVPQVVNGPDSEGPKGDDGSPGALGSGGPDAFGYRWVDSDDPLGPAFGWVDISGVGTPIALNGDDQNVGPIALPFAFPFYGGSFNEIRACSNGWLSFTSTATTFTNTSLPNAGSAVPANLIAPFWDDLDFRPATSPNSRAYHHYDGEKFIISYVDVPHFSSGGPYTFQVLLYPSGTIDFQYLSMATPTNSGTIGIQNATKDIGLQVAFNAAYLHDNLRVRITNPPGWLTVSPASGVVPAGGEFPLQVGFNATGLVDGDYTGQVRIASNDLDEPLTLIPAYLHVGVIAATVEIEPNSLNQNSNGNWVKGLVELPAGHDPAGIRISSVLVERIVPVDPNAPTEVADDDNDGIQDAMYKFNRSAVRAVLPTGDAVPVEVIGEEEDITWFAGTDVIRVKAPTQTVQMTNVATTYATGQSVPLAWQPYPGTNPHHYDLWYSGDGGGTWALVEGGMTVTSYDWTTPSVPTETGFIELVAVDDQGPMGSWVSPPLAIRSGVAGVEDEIPTQFGLRMMGPNPVAGLAHLELAMPERGSVDARVYDASGRQVCLIASGEFEPGRHLVEWNAKDETGASVGSGIYFARMIVQGRSYTTRFALMR